MYYTASVVMAVGQSVGSFLPYSAVLMRWFQRKRGRAMGILNAGNGSGYFLVPGLAFLIGAVGWRETLLIGAVAGLVVSLPLAITVVKDHPADKVAHNPHHDVDQNAVACPGACDGAGDPAREAPQDDPTQDAKAHRRCFLSPA